MIPSETRLADARHQAVLARREMMKTLAELEAKLQPAALVDYAWKGVRDRGEELADDAVRVVKERPIAVSGAAAAVALFLARDPIKSVLSRLLRRKDRASDDDRITATVVETHDYELSAPLAADLTAQGVKP